MSQITIEDVENLCAEQLPWAVTLKLAVERLGEGDCTCRLPFDDLHLRPGGTISGPSMMSLADFAMYVAVLSAIGPVHLAVTTSLNINFLRRPRPADLIAQAKVLKLGKRLAYGEVMIGSEGMAEDEPVAHATLTYSIPPR